MSCFLLLLGSLIYLVTLCFSFNEMPCVSQKKKKKSRLLICNLNINFVAHPHKLFHVVKETHFRFGPSFSHVIYLFFSQSLSPLSQVSREQKHLRSLKILKSMDLADCYFTFCIKF